MFNGFKRQRGSWSAMQATIAYTSLQDAHPSDVEVDCQSIDSFGDIRVLNNPNIEPANTNDVTISDTLINRNDGGFDESEEITSNELAILSTTSSSASISSLDQIAPEICPVHSGNSQKVDEWCIKNEQAGETVFPGDLTWRQDVGDNFTHPLLSGLSRDQILAIRRFSKELLPLLRRTRHNVQNNNNKFPRRYRDIPSVFYVRPSPSQELHRCSEDSSSFTDRSWLGWTMVPRFTESDIGPY
ncbi:ZYRO0D17116p [Zygosaccharomyces rouxii]|uniref:ZYRO0D17116p n=2 Tax=Zygosaccharomyces rouxii TaxID=4956 RepID=C5DWS1_ZYGRC|nr:uncharacterized protein ZYRO0D17116g [Zygosaccharomyces rouxii]KAH9201150.1 hypothetical protein LQ764DRAFT_103770 [Zygosaccharomyces rouxii]CAQ43500.1 Uncharacterized protein YJL185C [Zygosaccharomyces rouxii]CAR28240.1 ZYRO0D17116p [Zygosaccharomyces rouxii]